jgi:transposase-like protein
MQLPSWIKRLYGRKSVRPPSLTDCPKCGREMDMIDKSTMSGDDMRTYRCEHCQEEHIVNYGVALWKVLSDANNRRRCVVMQSGTAGSRGTLTGRVSRC